MLKDLHHVEYSKVVASQNHLSSCQKVIVCITLIHPVNRYEHYAYELCSKNHLLCFWEMHIILKLCLVSCDCYIKATKPLELLTALLEYLDCFYDIGQSTDFLAVKALPPYNASIIPNICSKLCWYNHCMPTSVWAWIQFVLLRAK